MQDENQSCVFCNITRGSVPSVKFYEDDKIIGVYDVNPWVEGHGLLMQREHIPIMPVMPPETFNYLFGSMPKVAKKLKEKQTKSNLTVFIANGAAAGQNSSHFLVHLLPDEDNLKFELDGEKIDGYEGTESMLANNLPIMMANHFKRSPADWHQEKIETPDHLQEVKAEGKTVYEDEKALCMSPKKPKCKGHLIIYSKEEEKVFENLDFETSSHLFYTSSYAATAVFEGLQAQGSNIILQESKNNKEGLLCIHVLPRWENDGLELMKKAEETTTSDIESEEKDNEEEKDPREVIRKAIERVKNS